MKNNAWHTLILGSLSFLAILLLWSALTYTGFVKPLFLPTPTSLLRGLFSLFMQRHFTIDILVSIGRILCGFLVAVGLSIPLGLAIGLHPRTGKLLNPILSFVRYTPTPALIPLFILWFGIGETEKIFVIAQAVFFQLVIMVANAISFVPREIVESARTLGASQWQITMQVVFPFVKPRIYDDLRICVGWAWTVLLAAEIVGASSGIGLVIVEAQRLLKTEYVVAGILVIGLLGLATDYAMKRLYPLLFPWAPRLENHA